MAARDLTVWQASHRRHKHHRRPLGRPNGRPSRVDDCIGESFAFLHELIEDAFMHITPSGVDQNQHAGYTLHLATHRCHEICTISKIDMQPACVLERTHYNY